jgi:hypothetical protein
LGEEPPLTAAEKVTDVPAQILPLALEVIVTLGVELAVIETVISLEVTLAAVGHWAFEIITHRTTEPFASVADENVLLFVPVFTPFTCH